MKKIGKISINPEKVIKNEELVNLRGGYDLCLYLKCYNISGGYYGDLCISSDFNGDPADICRENWSEAIVAVVEPFSSQCGC